MMKYVIALIAFGATMSHAYAQYVMPQPTRHEARNAAYVAKAQQDKAVAAGATITATDLREHLSIIASDGFAGRETGSAGQHRAAGYIAGEFQKIGLTPAGDDGTYFQHITFDNNAWEQTYVVANGQRYKHLKDFYTFPSLNQNNPVQFAEAVTFLGYGIDDDAYSDYKGRDVSTEVVMIYSGEPRDQAGNSYITGDATNSKWTDNIRPKLEAAGKHGVKTVLIIDPDINKNIDRYRRFLIGGRLALPQDTDDAAPTMANSLFISPGMAKAILGKRMKKVIKARKKIEADGRPKTVRIPAQLQIVQQKDSEGVPSYNILGYLEGSDPQLKDELLVISAHYDHLGTRGEDIFNGADDNGSGTSTIIEVAEALVEAKRWGVGPRRSVLFLLVTAEEKGLLGSEYYVNHPKYPLANTIADINVDMVGRVDQVYEAQDNPYYIYVIGSDRLSTDLHNINERVNKQYTDLTLDYKYNAEDDPNRYYYRSDHYNFAELGIPSIFFFNGTHDDYHRATDTVEKINFEKMETIGRLVYHLALDLTTRAERIKVDVKP